MGIGVIYIMKHEMIKTRDGTKLYVEYNFNGFANTILILHGGPGQGCWQFKYLAELLSKKFNVISFDQRGVLRSDEICYPFHSEMLIDDIEDLRLHFNIDKLIPLGHSYGGQLALRYAVNHSSHIRNVIYICPSFNFLYSLQNVYLQSYKLLQTEDVKTLAQLKKCVDTDNIKSLLAHLTDIPETTLNKVYGNYNISKEVSDAINNNSIENNNWAKGIRHQQCVFNESDIYFDYSSILKDVLCNSLLIVGESDPICTQIQMKCFIESNVKNEIQIISNSGHSPHIENPSETVSVIEKFSLSQ